MHTQIIAVSRTSCSVIFKSAVFNSVFNKDKNEQNEKLRFTRLMKPEGDVAWARIELPKMMTCG